MTYGERLREMRAERRLSLRQVEERGGPNKDTMSLIERDVHKPHPQTLGRIAEALELSVSELRAELEGAERPLGQAPPSPTQSPLNGLEEERRGSWDKWRSQLELLESCVQYKISRAEYYEAKLERGRSSEYATARGAEDLAISALEEFAEYTRWVIDKPVRPLAIALEQVPSPVDPRIAEEFEAKVDVMLARAKQTTDLLFNHAYHLAETAELRKELAQKRQQAEERAAYREIRSA